MLPFEWIHSSILNRTSNNSHIRQVNKEMLHWIKECQWEYVFKVTQKNHHIVHIFINSNRLNNPDELMLLPGFVEQNTEIHEKFWFLLIMNYYYCEWNKRFNMYRNSERIFNWRIWTILHHITKDWLETEAKVREV